MIVVGIAGGSASGKTWLAEGLTRALGNRAVLLSHDRYYRPLPAAHRACPDAYDFDHPDALETSLLVEHLTALRSNRPVLAPRYAFHLHDRVGEARVEPREVVVVDGLLVLAEPALRETFDLTVYVDAPHEVRRARRVERDVRERGRSPEEAAQRFDRHVAPTHARLVEPSRTWAELVVDGRDPLGGLVAQVHEAVRSRLG